MEKELEKTIERKKLVHIYKQLNMIKFQDPRNEWASKRNLKFFQNEFEVTSDKLWDVDEKYVLEDNGQAKRDEQGNLIIKRENEAKAKKDREKVLAEKVKVKFYQFQVRFKNGSLNSELNDLPAGVIVNLDFLVPDQDECPSDEFAEQVLKERMKGPLSGRKSFTEQN